MNRVPWWVWVSATPMGLGAWAPIAPGRQRGRPRWIAAGVLWSVVALVGWVAAIITDGGAGGDLLIILGWVGAVATALVIRPAYMSESASSFERHRAAAEQRLQERREIVELRAELNGLASANDLGGVVDLDGNAVERLRDRVVFLPRY